jgi:hypothetical protein
MTPNLLTQELATHKIEEEIARAASLSVKRSISSPAERSRLVGLRQTIGIALIAAGRWVQGSDAGCRPRTMAAGTRS